MLRVFIGFDQQETVAYHVLCHSLLRHSTGPLSITPLVKSQLANVYHRKREPYETTDFSLTRFLVPNLSNYEGYALYLDCDMLCRSDPYELLLYGLAAPEQAVHVVKHNYTPSTTRKFLGHQQTVYPRKNWSSVMFFNNAKCRALSIEYINTTTPMALHRFEWLKDHEIGELPREWNWLVSEYKPNPRAKLLHYTLGAPCFEEYAKCDHADLWHAELAMMTCPVNLTVLEPTQQAVREVI
jgi:lipopolysaccharide biosynthesis glycosyltransferase